MTIFLFVLGAIVGSFLNVVILRYNTGKGLSGRSQCFSCQTELSWYELIPIVSFVLLRGRCRSCRSAISTQYALVEVLTAVIFALTSFTLFPEGVIREDQVPEALLYLTIFSLLIVIFVYDLRHKIIPDGFVYAFSGISLLGMLTGITSHVNLTVGNVLAGPVFFLPFALLWLVSNGRWMGFGDAKLALGIGWFLGFMPGVVALLLSFYIGAAVGIVLMALRRLLSHYSRGGNNSLFLSVKNLTMNGEIPFAPFLIIGLWIVFFWDVSLVDVSSFGSW